MMVTIQMSDSQMLCNLYDSSFSAWSAPANSASWPVGQLALSIDSRRFR